MRMVENRDALCVPGNHENKLLRRLNGRDVIVSYGLGETLAQIEALSPDERSRFVERARAFIDGLISHYWLDDGKLVVAHAGLRAEMHGRGSAEVRDFALWGETTGETDAFGLPVRYDWAKEYRGSAMVAYGHTPTRRAEWLNKTICLDTGCVYGGLLTALRYPALELVEVPAARVSVEPVRPLDGPKPSAGAHHLADDVVDVADVSGKRRIETRYLSSVTIPAESAAAALEVMSRFCVDPRWLIYLPPTMSPPETSHRQTVLEHPDEAFGYFRRHDVHRVVVEEKHRGGRAVIVLARDAAAARRRFGVEEGRGVIVTRTGRAFFSGAQAELGDELLSRIGGALDRTDFWARFTTDWLCLDAEITPWSTKAQALIDARFRPVGEAALAGLGAAAAALRMAVTRHVDAMRLLERVEARRHAAAGYVDAYRRYVRLVRSVDDLLVAPFHLLATEGAVHVDRDHRWQMETLAEICAADPRSLGTTAYREIALDDEEQIAESVRWWEELSASGGEGVVVKPLAFVPRAPDGKESASTGPQGEGARVSAHGLWPRVYAPRASRTTSRARSGGQTETHALLEFSLGLEALHRFVEHAPLRAVHECVFGVLALESEPVDPRL